MYWSVEMLGQELQNNILKPNITSENIEDVVAQLVVSFTSMQQYIQAEQVNRTALSNQLLNIENEQRKCGADLTKAITELMLSLHKDFATQSDVDTTKTRIQEDILRVKEKSDQDRKELKDCIDQLRRDTVKDIRWSLGLTFAGGAFMWGIIQFVITLL